VQKILDLYKKGKVKESTIIKMAAFKTEIEALLSSKDMTKEAVATKSVLIGAALAPPILAASNFLIGKAIDTFEEANKGNYLNQKFEKMLEYRPDLKAEDQLLVKKYWDSLVHFAPAIANDPLAAGAYIKQAIQYEEVGGPPFSTIESLVKTQKSYKDAQPLRSRGIGESIAESSSKFKL